MSTITEKIQLAINSKIAITNALRSIGIDVDGVPLSGYAELISGLHAGGGSDSSSNSLNFYKCSNIVREEVENQSSSLSSLTISGFPEEYAEYNGTYNIVDDTAEDIQREWKNTANNNILTFSGAYMVWSINGILHLNNIYDENPIGSSNDNDYDGDPIACTVQISIYQELGPILSWDGKRLSEFGFENAVTTGLIISGYTPELNGIYSYNTLIRIDNISIAEVPVPEGGVMVSLFHFDNIYNNSYLKLKDETNTVIGYGGYYTSFGSPSYTPSGKFGDNCMNFNDYPYGDFTIYNLPQLSAFTIEYWQYCRSRYPYGIGGNLLIMPETDSQQEVTLPRTTISRSDSEHYHTDTWMHFAWVREENSSSVTEYLNGEAIGTIQFSEILGGRPVTIVSNTSDGNGQAVHTLIDELAIFNYAKYRSEFTPPSAPYQNINSNIYNKTPRDYALSGFQIFENANDATFVEKSNNVFVNSTSSLFIFFNYDWWEWVVATSEDLYSMNYNVFASASNDDDSTVPDTFTESRSGATVTFSANNASSTPVITVETPVSITGTVGTAIENVQLSATVSDGGTPQFNSSDILSGLTLTQTGLISGTPATSGINSSSVTVSYTGAENQTITINYNINAAAQSSGNNGGESGEEPTPSGNNGNNEPIGFILSGSSKTELNGEYYKEIVNDETQYRKFLYYSDFLGGDIYATISYDTTGSLDEPGWKLVAWFDEEQMEDVRFYNSAAGSNATTEQVGQGPWQRYYNNLTPPVFAGLIYDSQGGNESSESGTITGYLISGCGDSDFNGTFEIDENLTQGGKPVYKHYSEEATMAMGYDTYTYLFYSDTLNRWNLGWDNYSNTSNAAYYNNNVDPTLGIWSLGNWSDEMVPPSTISALYSSEGGNGGSNESNENNNENSPIGFVLTGCDDPNINGSYYETYNQNTGITTYDKDLGGGFFVTIQYDSNQGGWVTFDDSVFETHYVNTNAGENAALQEVAQGPWTGIGGYPGAPSLSGLIYDSSGGNNNEGEEIPAVNPLVTAALTDPDSYIIRVKTSQYLVDDCYPVGTGSPAWDSTTFNAIDTIEYDSSTSKWRMTGGGGVDLYECDQLDCTQSNVWKHSDDLGETWSDAPYVEISILE